MTDRHLQRQARRELGVEPLRPGQEEAVSSVLEGRDTLVVMPTGSGKSMIYQLAGSRLAGGTVVVSPLLALQRRPARLARRAGRRRRRGNRRQHERAPGTQHAA